MFRDLFLKESKEILKSITYYIFLACMILFFVTQMGEFKGISKPREGMDSYGEKYSDDELLIMNSTLNILTEEYNNNNYTTYPVGVYKEVKLNSSEEARITNIIEDISVSEGTAVKDGLTFAKFSEYMEEVDNILGGEAFIVARLCIEMQQFLRLMKML